MCSEVSIWFEIIFFCIFLSFSAILALLHSRYYSHLSLFSHFFRLFHSTLATERRNFSYGEEKLDIVKKKKRSSSSVTVACGKFERQDAWTRQSFGSINAIFDCGHFVFSNKFSIESIVCDPITNRNEFKLIFGEFNLNATNSYCSLVWTASVLCWLRPYDWTVATIFQSSDWVRPMPTTVNRRWKMPSTVDIGTSIRRSSIEMRSTWERA